MWYWSLLYWTWDINIWQQSRRNSQNSSLSTISDILWNDGCRFYSGPTSTSCMIFWNINWKEKTLFFVFTVVSRIIFSIFSNTLVFNHNSNSEKIMIGFVLIKSLQAIRKVSHFISILLYVFVFVSFLNKFHFPFWFIQNWISL
jgi:hypothetical protein